MVPCKSTAEEVSFEWSHHRISSTDLKVGTTLHVSIIGSGRGRVKLHSGKQNKAAVDFSEEWLSFSSFQLYITNTGT